jgi:hypothetical protein
MCQTVEGVRGVTSTRTVLPATLCHIRCSHSVHVNPHATTAHHRITHATSPDMPPHSESQGLDGDIDRIVVDAIAQIHDTALDTTSSETTRHCVRRNSIACGALSTKPLHKIPCRAIRQVEEQHLRHPATSTALSRQTSTRSGITTTPYISTTCVTAGEQLSHKDRLVLPGPTHEPHLTEPRVFYPADDSDGRSSPFSAARRRRPAEPAAVSPVEEYDDHPSPLNPSRRYDQASTSYNLLRWQRGYPLSFVEHHARTPLSSAGYRARWKR